MTAKFCVSWSLAIVGFMACVPARAAVEVVPFRLEETRCLALGDDKVSRGFPSLKVTFSLNGPEAESSVRYGQLQLTMAADDQGGSLLPTKDVFNDDAKFRDYSNAFFRNSPGFGNRQPAAPQIEMNLAVPKRSATKIAHLRGTVSLAEKGTIHSVEVIGLKTSGSKTLDIPVEAHLKIVATVASGENPRSISLEITGDESALESIELIDGAGKRVSSGLSSWTINGGPVHKSINAGKPVDDSMKLVAKVATDRKVVQVPFDLSNIPLP